MSWTRREPAATEPSTARKAFVSATTILVASNGVTEPLRRITRYPGSAVCAVSAVEGTGRVRVPLDGSSAVAGIIIPDAVGDGGRSGRMPECRNRADSEQARHRDRSEERRVGKE